MDWLWVVLGVLVGLLVGWVLRGSRRRYPWPRARPDRKSGGPGEVSWSGVRELRAPYPSQRPTGPNTGLRRIVELEGKVDVVECGVRRHEGLLRLHLKRLEALEESAVERAEERLEELEESVSRVKGQLERRQGTLGTYTYMLLERVQKLEEQTRSLVSASVEKERPRDVPGKRT